MKTINYITGLPRAGSTVITNILKQNPKIHGEVVSSLSPILSNIKRNWSLIEENRENPNEDAKVGVLNSILQGYYSHIDKPIIFDKNLGWISNIGLLESILQKQVKMLVCVRNPAQILSSFERLHRENPLFQTRADQSLQQSSNIATRAYYYAGPDGILGLTHRGLKDAIVMGYSDRLLFVDYERYCNSPKSQTKRIYDFFEIPHFDHDFNNIIQTEKFNDLESGIPNSKVIRPELVKTTVNCVEYLGLDLYEQYNREIFWNAWI